jgi:ribosomal protein L15
MAVARRDIKEGEELFITYQVPNLSLARRRMLLWREYMFGPCQCERCIDDESQLNEDERKEMNRGGLKKDEKEEEEIKMRREHAAKIDALEKERNEKLIAEGRPIPEKDLTGLEDELRAKLGF